ncbi:hypothetical protein, partial [Rhodobaculum claviforme]|uniref:hypothetical protein n=1 Tax=Rhodobaculum claviforme TaxID=1549854 RepID=UPI001A90EE83
MALQPAAARRVDRPANRQQSARQRAIGHFRPGVAEHAGIQPGKTGRMQRYRAGEQRILRGLDRPPGGAEGPGQGIDMRHRK